MPATGVIILCHGSRGERGTLEVAQTLRRLTEGVRPLLPPQVEVIGAALQFNHPNLEEAVASLTSNGIQSIIIMPYFLFPGRHITEHIPQLIQSLKARYPEVQFTIAKTLGIDEALITQVASRIIEAAPELNPHPQPTSPPEIERQSIEIIEGLLSPLPSLSAEESLIVKYIVHASGDPKLAELVRFSPQAIASGLDAITKGSPIFTDVRMVAAGINKRLASAFGCSVFCALDENETENPASTRAEAGMRHLGARLDSSIVVIGNAPTALLALIELVDRDGIRPALTIGMPVGFVQAKEAKDELIKRNIPYITVVGTRGGSALAVATANTLLRIAGGRYKC